VIGLSIVLNLQRMVITRRELERHWWRAVHDPPSKALKSPILCRLIVPAPPRGL